MDALDTHSQPQVPALKSIIIQTNIHTQPANEKQVDGLIKSLSLGPKLRGILSNWDANL